jgi:hypothetical protein
MPDAQKQEIAPSNREPFVPDIVTCPEGIWAIEALCLLEEKKSGNLVNKRKMGEIAQAFAEFLLLNPELEVFTISSYSGRKEKLDRDYLRSKGILTDLLRGFTPSSGYYGRTENGDYIFVNKNQFENFLADRPFNGLPVEEKKTIQARPSSKYTPPYLAFMLQAVEALKLTPDKRENKEAVIDWLTKNWPADLEGKSSRMIESMATLLRRPEDKKGGNTPWD